MEKQKNLENRAAATNGVKGEPWITSRGPTLSQHRLLSEDGTKADGGTDRKINSTLLSPQDDAAAGREEENMEDQRHQRSPEGQRAETKHCQRPEETFEKLEP
ncbi:hypothetical protein EYF80_022250 [Liparis tanakae]|uniref:Uncharacterized protein n=1 Tax=Liparis tanakae TaxID=230148 RepID=A0A4Z2HP74_9TELE|nr:hypothetical protein EYF80_022250 [Liparis tanakae]